MIAILAVSALAQDYRLPIADEHAQYAYPTAYVDHGGSDWACGDVTYPGHEGTDIGVGGFDGMDAGRVVVAAAAGVVVAANDGEFDRCTTADCGTTGFGNYAAVQHADGKLTEYAHMKSGSVAVVVGQSVACGAPLGLVGSSGWSSGPHVHFGVWDTASSAYADPFWGDCSAAPSYWVAQGDYMGLPGVACDTPDRCVPVATLGCGDTVYRAAGDPGATSTHAYWGACTTFAEFTGAETAWTVVPDRDGPVTVTMSGLSADLDLFVLASDTCDATDCLGASTDADLADGVVTVDGRVGVPLTVVVDGYDGASSDVTVTVACSGAPPDPDVGDTDSDPDDTDDAGDTDTDVQGGRVDTDVEARGGCACDGAAPGGLGLAAVALVGAALARRRNTRP